MRAVAPQMIASGGTVSQGNGMLGVSGSGSVTITANRFACRHSSQTRRNRAKSWPKSLYEQGFCSKKLQK